MNSESYVAVIMAEGKHNEMYPLTTKYPMANLLISNKRLIAYQLEQLEAIQGL